jgi:hypothetical protein
MDFDDKLAYGLFIGIEQEGPYRGTKSLFVVGDVPFAIICSYLYNHKLHCVYFGAGGRFDFNPTTVKDLARASIIHRPYAITIESPRYDRDLHLAIKLDNCNWVIPYVWQGKILQEGLDSLINLGQRISSVYAKIDTGKEVIVHPWLGYYGNSYNEGYSEDKLLLVKER